MSTRVRSPALGTGTANAPDQHSLREFRFTERDFHRVRDLIYRRAGIALKSGKQEMVYSRLAKRLRALGLATFEEYLTRLDSETSPEWENFVNAITTNLTYFFREPHHFTLLTQQLRAIDARERINIWSAGTATGEEAYSLAMTVADAIPDRLQSVTILASDVDTTVLDEASRGIYKLERLQSVAADVVRRHFLRGVGPQAGLAKVRSEYRNMISFKRINLIESDWGITYPVHAIFCRNVMIYFDKATQYRILQRMRGLLSPEGRLYAGHSENFFHAKDLFQLCDRTVYRPVVER